MATTLDEYAPFDTGAGADVTESMWRKFMRRLLADGVLAFVDNDFEVFADSTGMQVKVKTGEAWIQGHWGHSTAQKTLSIATAHATLARKDRVIIRADFDNNRLELDVKTGTAAASPVVPTLTQNTAVWEIALATINVTAADTSIDAAQVVDERTRVGTTGGDLEYYQNAGQTIATGTGSLKLVQFNTAVRTTPDVAVSGTGNTTFTIKRAGTWSIASTVAQTTNGSGGNLFFATIRDSVNSVRLVTGTTTTFSTESCSIGLSTTQHFNIGDAIQVGTLQTTGSNATLDVFEKVTRIKMTWISDA